MRGSVNFHAFMASIAHRLDIDRRPDCGDKPARNRSRTFVVFGMTFPQAIAPERLTNVL